MGTSGSLLGARRLRQLLDRHGVKPRKALGQNFVVDPNTIRKIVNLSGAGIEDHVLEIGAGAGSLTLGLAAAAGRVIAVEFDHRMLAVLSEAVSDLTNVDIVEADALTLDLASIEATKMVGNLPYNIATPLVLRTLERAPQLAELTVMTQKEVGERLAAKPGAKSYGQASVLVRYFSEPKVVARISRQAFWPVPGVDSVVVRLSRRAGVLDVPFDRLSAVVKTAFSQRRKTLRNTLAPLSDSTAGIEEVLRAAGINPGARAEEIDLDGFAAIAKALL
ncbi:MAG: 16S rRNA (adenine(1518)-N(6)/adenine(1519)-N(6))-dimethyltransferase RsmA [Actinomycetota bacterium]